MIIKALLSPILWLGIGIGSGLGFLLGTGISFTNADGAKFLGALFGSVIAVGSAISLYYLKERDETKKIRSHLLKILSAGESDAKRALRHIKEKDYDELKITLLVLANRAKRIERFFARFEYEDELISEAAICAELNHADFLEEVSDTDLANIVDGLDKILIHHQRSYLTAIGVLKEESSLDSTS